MAGRRLSPDERVAWTRLANTIRPLKAVPVRQDEEAEAAPVAAQPRPSKVVRKPLTSLPPEPVRTPPRRPVDRLDDSWEKQIRRGSLMPDATIDLHGYNLASARARLDRMLSMARAQGSRVLLVITGKPRPASDSNRGAIRAEIGHWLEVGPHADAIASVRVAHPRHGGQGAIYIILRRKL